jgi:hypothetical protein
MAVKTGIRSKTGHFFTMGDVTIRAVSPPLMPDDHPKASPKFAQATAVGRHNRYIVHDSQIGHNRQSSRRKSRQ